MQSFETYQEKKQTLAKQTERLNEYGEKYIKDKILLNNYCEIIDNSSLSEEDKSKTLCALENTIEKLKNDFNQNVIAERVKVEKENCNILKNVRKIKEEFHNQAKLLKEEKFVDMTPAIREIEKKEENAEKSERELIYTMEDDICRRKKQQREMCVDTNFSEKVKIEKNPFDEKSFHDISPAMLIRQVLDQNVEEQKLPSDNKVLWSNFGNRGNGNCELKNDVEVKVVYKSSGKKATYSGAEFKEHMREKYGMDYVKYSHKEPDFTPFERIISKPEMEDFVFQKHGKKIDMTADISGHLYVDEMKVKRRGNQGTYECAEKIISRSSGVEINDLRDFMKENNLTFHECGDRHTIQIIPSEINQVFGHTGGIGVQKDFEALVKGIENITKVSIQKLALDRKETGGIVDNLIEPIQNTHTYYHNIKKQDN